MKHPEQFPGMLDTIEWYSNFMAQQAITISNRGDRYSSLKNPNTKNITNENMYNTSFGFGESLRDKYNLNSPLRFEFQKKVILLLEKIYSVYYHE